MNSQMSFWRARGDFEDSFSSLNISIINWLSLESVCMKCSVSSCAFNDGISWNLTGKRPFTCQSPIIIHICKTFNKRFHLLIWGNFLKDTRKIQNRHGVQKSPFSPYKQSYSWNKQYQYASQHPQYSAKGIFLKAFCPFFQKSVACWNTNSDSISTILALGFIGSWCLYSSYCLKESFLLFRGH